MKIKPITTEISNSDRYSVDFQFVLGDNHELVYCRKKLTDKF